MTEHIASAESCTTGAERAPCAFCNRDAYAAVTGLYDGLPPELLDDLVIARAPGYRLVLDVAPVAPFHCMIIPDEHVSSFAYAPAAEWQPLVDDLESALVSLTARACTRFEHGVRPHERKGGCCVDHAHLHVVPLGHVHVLDVVRSDGYPVVAGSLTDPLLRDRSYLYVRDADGTEAAFDGDVSPSQYLRRVIGGQAGATIWHWHDYVQLTKTATLVERLSGTASVLREALHASPLWSVTRGIRDSLTA